MEEQKIQQRIEQVLEEIKKLPQAEKYNIEIMPDGNNIYLKLSNKTKKHNIIERIIHPNEDLSFLAYTFGYPNTLTPGSIMPSKHELREAHFNQDGFLVLTHNDGSIDHLKVSKDHREEVNELLQAHLGSKFNK
jgi:hypothetical protein